MNAKSGLWAIGAVVLTASALMIGAGDPARPSNESVGSTGGIAADLGAAEFLAGCWQGAMGKNKDSFVEETWSAPNGRNVIGMFRWNKPDGTASVQEILTITEEDGTLVLRLRHQNAAGAAWEDKDKPVVLVLKEKGPALLRFDALRDTGEISLCRYAMKDGKLYIDVEFVAPGPDAIASGKKQRPSLNFELGRAKLEATR